MKRRVVVLQRSAQRVAPVARALAERGHAVVVAGSRREAASLIADRCGVLLIDAPDVRACDRALCRWVRDTVRPMPAMVGLLSESQQARPECAACMVALDARAGVEAVTRAVERAGQWWPGDT